MNMHNFTFFLCYSIVMYSLKRCHEFSKFKIHLIFFISFYLCHFSINGCYMHLKNQVHIYILNIYIEMHT